MKKRDKMPPNHGNSDWDNFAWDNFDWDNFDWKEFAVNETQKVLSKSKY